ncbi:hypothetical protein FQN54_009041 [Arachnomyces sp. PD_36]|nr:hypothetical protein FQN54_009041 [Arachnomyces sp. PD_36]
MENNGNSGGMPDPSMGGGGYPRYTPTQPYFSNAPARPHMSVPPLSYVNGELGGGPVDLQRIHAFPPGEFASAEFLSTAGSQCFDLNIVVPEWTYGMRRKAQMILPFLYLGPSSATKDLEFLRAEGITLLLAIRTTQSAQAHLVGGSKAAAELGIEADSFDVLDQQGLIAVLPSVIRQINDHICPASPSQFGSVPQLGVNGNGQRKVLVFCESGNERSASVIVAYLMAMVNLDLFPAIHAVQSRRFCISIEEQMRHALASFHSILQAKRDVARASPPKHGQFLSIPPDSKLMKKRSIDDVGAQVDAPMDMAPDMNGDDERFLNREGSAPFQDTQR